MILGGSVAFGAYSSEISKTYFNVLGRTLEQNSIPTYIIVAAGGAWKSCQELAALDLYTRNNKVDLIVFLNGINDLTTGSFSKTLQGVPVKTLDGTKWTVFYHAQDYDERVKDYLANMKKAITMAHERDLKVLIVLQPALFERRQKSRMEKKLMKLYLRQFKCSKATFPQSYEAMRRGLAEYEKSGEVYFLDCSSVFDSEKKTTFSDIWHFSDPGHEILGRVMAEKIATILNDHQ